MEAMLDGVTVVQEEKTLPEPCRGNGSTLAYAAVLLPSSPSALSEFHTPSSSRLRTCVLAVASEALGPRSSRDGLPSAFLAISKLDSLTSPWGLDFTCVFLGALTTLFGGFPALCHQDVNPWEQEPCLVTQGCIHSG